MKYFWFDNMPTLRQNNVKKCCKIITTIVVIKITHSFPYLTYLFQCTTTIKTLVYV